MERAELLENLEKINSKLSTLDVEEVFTYITKDKYLPGHGPIVLIETIKELVEFKASVDKQLKTDFSSAIQGLGLTDEEIGEYNKTNSVQLLGFKAEHWQKDIRTKLEEIRHFALIKKLTNAKSMLEKHLSADDKFKLDTDGIESLVEQC